MKNTFLPALLVAAAVLASQRGFAADTNDAVGTTNASTVNTSAVAPANEDVKAEVDKLVANINAKLEQGRKTEGDLADDIKEFDALLARHKGETTDAVANILTTKAELYKDVFGDPERAAEIYKRVKLDFPQTEAAQRVDAILKSLAVIAEVRDLTVKLQTRVQQGDNTESSLADILKEFDALLAKHKGETTEAVANILTTKARVYLEVLHDPDKAAETFKQIKRDFPLTKAGQNMDQMIDSVQTTIVKERIRRSLVEGAKFPDFSEKDVNGQPLSVANFKGKVVLIDFWATWCPPCMIELPGLLKVYEQYHSQGLEIIGVSLDEDPQKLQQFLRQSNIPWPQYCDGKQYDNKLAEKCGVWFVPTSYLLDGEGKIIAKDLRETALTQAIARALVKK
jgi:peroxiredoxin